MGKNRSIRSPPSVPARYQENKIARPKKSQKTNGTSFDIVILGAKGKQQSNPVLDQAPKATANGLEEIEGHSNGEKTPLCSFHGKSLSSHKGEKEKKKEEGLEM